MRYRDEIDGNGQAPKKTLQADKPIRKGVTIGSGVWRKFDKRRELIVIGRIHKEDLPQAERQFGDVLLTPVYTGSGHAIGYVKQVDLAGN